jgi:hypothetical protein
MAEEVQVNVAVVYESKTGTTRRAALAIGDGLFDRGVRCLTFPASSVDASVAAEADTVVVGTWTDGLFVVGQRPGGHRRLESAVRQLAGPEGDGLRGKRCVVYCTYAINPGRTLERLGELLSAAGADVVGGLAIRRDSIEEGVGRLVEVVADHATV